MEPLWTALALGLGYLLGSIPYGLVLTRLAGLGDIRKVGSGNIGATNVLRTGNKPLAAAVLVLDSGKGAAAVFLASLLTTLIDPSDPMAVSVTAELELAALAGVTAVIGHNFPVWLGFKGGKGVATTLGTLAALAWPVGISACAAWLVVAAISRYSSLSALVSLALTPAFAFALLPEADAWIVGLAALILALLVWVRHAANIRRLLRGEESKIKFKKSED